MGCGNWHEDYIKLHRDIMTGKVPNKQLVVVSIRSGFNDNLAPKINALYFALLTGRALRFVSYGTLPTFSTILNPRFLDLYANENDFPAEAIDPLRAEYNGTSCYGSIRTFTTKEEMNKTYSPLYLVNGDYRSFFLGGDLAQYKSDVEYLMHASNRAVTYHLVEDSSPENRRNRERLQQLGLRHGSNTFLCAFHFLFAPSHEVRRLFRKTWQRLSNPAVLKIGIHVRVGDAEFAAPHDLAKGRGQIEAYMDYFRCAQDIEDSRRAQNQSVLWYVLSDSLSIRLAAQERFGSKVLIDRHRAAHLDCESVATNCSSRALDASLVLAVGEMLAFSLADVHVFSKDSGYGRSGAWLSRQAGASGGGGRGGAAYKRQHLYDLLIHHRDGNRSCGRNNFADPNDDARQWSGI